MQTVALVGTPGPSPGSTYRSIKLPNVGDLGSLPVAYRASAKITGSPAQRGLFMGEPGVTATSVVSKGDLTPTGGGTFRTFSRPSVESTGRLAWRSRVSDFGQGIYQYDGAIRRTVVVRGAATPSGGTYHVFEVPVTTGLGGVVFHATVSGGGGVTEGIFLCSGGDMDCHVGSGTLQSLVVNGDAVTDRPGRSFCSFATGVRASSWGVAFRASTKMNCANAGESAAGGVFRLAYGGAIETLALVGETANSIAIGTASYGSFRDPPGIENDGVVAFRARVTAASSKEDGLYACDPASCPASPADARFAAGFADSEPMPHTVRRLDSPTIENSERIVFFASARGSSQGRAIYKLDPLATVPDLIVFRGDPVPDYPGATFHRPFLPNTSPLGKVAFRARVKNAPGSTGVFLWQ